MRLFFCGRGDWFSWPRKPEIPEIPETRKARTSSRGWGSYAPTGQVVFTSRPELYQEFYPELKKLPAPFIFNE